MKEITDETRVPLRWVIALLVGATGSLGGFVALGVWAGSIESKAESATSGVRELESKLEYKLDRNLELTQTINQRLSRLEGSLGLPPMKEK